MQTPRNFFQSILCLSFPRYSRDKMHIDTLNRLLQRGPFHEHSLVSFRFYRPFYHPEHRCLRPPYEDQCLRDIHQRCKKWISDCNQADAYAYRAHGGGWSPARFRFPGCYCLSHRKVLRAHRISRRTGSPHHRKNVLLLCGDRAAAAHLQLVRNRLTDRPHRVWLSLLHGLDLLHYERLLPDRRSPALSLYPRRRPARHIRRISRKRLSCGSYALTLRRYSAGMSLGL